MHEKIMMKIWQWLRDEHNRGALQLIGGIVVAITAGVWAIYINDKDMVITEEQAEAIEPIITSIHPDVDTKPQLIVSLVAANREFIDFNIINNGPGVAFLSKYRIVGYPPSDDNGVGTEIARSYFSSTKNIPISPLSTAPFRAVPTDFHVDKLIIYLTFIDELGNKQNYSQVIH